MRVSFCDRTGTYNEIDCYMVLETRYEKGKFIWCGCAMFETDDEYLLAVQHNITDLVDVLFFKKQGIYKGKARIKQWNPKQLSLWFEGEGILNLFESIKKYKPFQLSIVRKAK